MMGTKKLFTDSYKVHIESLIKIPILDKDSIRRVIEFCSYSCGRHPKMNIQLSKSLDLHPAVEFPTHPAN